MAKTPCRLLRRYTPKDARPRKNFGILPLSVVEALDREITLGQQIMLAGYFRRQPCEIAAMSYETVRSSPA
jgi:hypothetical protein